jgi:hypothetical protein
LLLRLAAGTGGWRRDMIFPVLREIKTLRSLCYQITHGLHDSGQLARDRPCRSQGRPFHDELSARGKSHPIIRRYEIAWQLGQNDPDEVMETKDPAPRRKRADAALTKIAEIAVNQHPEAAEIVALQRMRHDQRDDLCNLGVRYSFLELGDETFFAPTIRFAVSFGGNPSRRNGNIAPTLNVGDVLSVT